MCLEIIVNQICSLHLYQIIPTVKPVVVHTHHRVFNTSTCPQPFRRKALTSNTPAVAQCKKKPEQPQVAEEVKIIKVEKMPALLEEPDGDSQGCKQCKVRPDGIESEYYVSVLRIARICARNSVY